MEGFYTLCFGGEPKNCRIVPVDMGKARAKMRVKPVANVGSVDLVNCWAMRAPIKP
ncbi:MAG: hypothetical protein ABC537_01170 [Candidatus Methanosuratincola sp.]